MRKSTAVRSLLDVNVLIALAFPNQASHRAAHEWFAAQPDRKWASCPLTQAGFLRVATRILGGTREALHAAFLALDQNCQSPGHRFWPTPVDLRALDVRQRSRLTGPSQITDLQLLLAARHHRGQLVTFDTGLRVLAAAAGHDEAVVVLPVAKTA